VVVDGPPDNLELHVIVAEVGVHLNGLAIYEEHEIDRQLVLASAP